MSREKRVELIKKIEEKRSSNLICYVTGDRQGPFTAKIADDAVRFFRVPLDTFNKVKQIDLFLYSRGGTMLTPLRLVRLIREHCGTFDVLIPYRAHSAATLIALGADEIVMGKYGELSPVDPTTVHPFNPPADPANPKQKLPISVEDVTSYFLLAKERAGIRDEQMVNIFNELANKIHPLALGNIYRSYRMSRLLTKKMLTLHLNWETEKHKIEDIIKNLTEVLSIHGYQISRKEAKREIGLNIVEPVSEVEGLMWSLYEEYEKDMQLREPFNPLLLLQGKKMVEFSYESAYIESKDTCNAFVIEGTINQTEPKPGQVSASVNVKGSMWKRIV